MRPLPHVASAVRMSQYLGLDKLWKSREEMPLLPDPAVPERPSLLARQIGARLWTTTVFLEGMRCSKEGDVPPMIPLDTPRPPVGNYNDEDLGWDLYTPERPSTEWTSGSVDGFKAQLATLGMRTLNLRRTDSVCHEDVYKFDEEMKEVLNHQVVPQSICDTCSLPLSFVDKAWKLTVATTVKLKLMESGIHYRILRLHRPYMVKGLQDSQFRRSYDVSCCPFCGSVAWTLIKVMSFRLH